MINAEVQRHGNESSVSLMRRFSRKVQSAGTIKRMRSLRYFKRNASAAQMKKDALTRIERTDHYVDLYKQGREIPTKRRR